jgi:hypothetical protein
LGCSFTFLSFGVFAFGFAAATLPVASL